MLAQIPLVREVSSDQSRASLPKLVRRAGDLSHLKDLFSGQSLASNILLVGERGVGRRTLVEHLASELRTSSRGATRELLELDLTELRGSTSQTEEAVTQLIERTTEGLEVCLYIEDFEILFRNISKNAPHFHRIVKLIRSKKLTVVGTLSGDGLAWLRRSEPEVVRNSTILRIKPLSSRDTLTVLRNRREDMCSLYSVDISSAAMRAAAELSRDCLPGQTLPGGALDILQKACSRHTMKRQVGSQNELQESHDESLGGRNAEISHYDVKRVIEELGSLGISSESAQNLSEKVHARLERVVLGQEEALRDLSSAIEDITTDFGACPRPSGFLMLVGPRGTGKSLALQTLAEAILHDEQDMAVFDLREFSTDSSIRGLFGMDSRRRMDEMDAGVEQATHRSPISLLVFEHVSDAPPYFFQILEAILATGNYRTAWGARVDLRRAVLVLTDDLHHRDSPGSRQGESSPSYAESLVPPKIAHSLGAVVRFGELREEDYLELIKRRVNDFRREFRDGRPKCRIHRAVLKQLIASARDSKAGAKDLVENLEKRIFGPARLILQKKSDLKTLRLSVTLESGDIRVRLDTRSKQMSVSSRRES